MVQTKRERAARAADPVVALCCCCWVNEVEFSHTGRALDFCDARCRLRMADERRRDRDGGRPMPGSLSTGSVERAEMVGVPPACRVRQSEANDGRAD